VSNAAAISTVIALAGLIFVVLGVRTSSRTAKEVRANQLHSVYFVADRSRAFLAIGAVLVLASAVIIAVS
jgi:hypothetical protein